MRLMRRLIGVLLFLPLLVSAAGPTAGPVHLDADRSGRYELRKEVSYLEDPEGRLTLSDVTAPSNAANWRAAPDGPISFGYSSSAYWFTFSLQGSRASEWMLEIGYPLLDDVQLWVLTDEIDQQYVKTGDHLPIQSRPIFHRNFVLPIHLGNDGTARVYLRVESINALRIPLTLWQERALHGSDQWSLVGETLYYGIVIAMLMYNLFIYVVIRDRSYLTYVAALAFVAVFISSFHGVFYQFLWSDWMPIWWNDRITVLTASGACFFGSLFTSQFLGLKEKYPLRAKWFTVITVLSVLALVAVLLLPYPFSVRAVMGLCVVTNLSSLTSAFYVWRHSRNAPAGYFFIATAALLIGAVALSLSLMGFLPSNFWSDHSLQIGSAVDAVLLSFALADRFRVLREQNLAMQRYVTEQLQRAVHEKQEELERNHARLQELERDRVIAAERERIMRDMHDGVGGSLVSALSLMERKGTRREAIIQSLRDALDDLRLMIASLNPSGEALIPSLAMLRRRLETRLEQSGMTLEWRLDELPGTDQFGPEKVLHVMRFVQEAATNAVMHSGGTRLSVGSGVERHNGVLRAFVEITDDGHGISHKRTLGRGLRNMQRRAELVGGEFELASGSEGTRVRLWLPLVN